MHVYIPKQTIEIDDTDFLSPGLPLVDLVHLEMKETAIAQIMWCPLFLSSRYRYIYCPLVVLHILDNCITIITKKNALEVKSESLCPNPLLWSAKTYSDTC